MDVWIKGADGAQDIVGGQFVLNPKIICTSCLSPIPFCFARCVNDIAGLFYFIFFLMYLVCRSFPLASVTSLPDSDHVSEICLNLSRRRSSENMTLDNFFCFW